MAQEMKFYAYNTSVSHAGDIFEPGAEIPLDVIRAIPRANLRVLLGSGQIITQAQREAIEQAKRIADAKDSDQLPPIGCGEESFMELPLIGGSTAGLSAATNQLKKKRGEAPLREIEAFLDGETEDFEDENPDPASTADDVVVDPADVPTIIKPEDEAPDFKDEAPQEPVEGEDDDPLAGMFNKSDEE